MKRFVVAVFAGATVVAATGVALAARGSSSEAPPPAASVAPASAPYGEATVRVRNAWAATLRCQYEHGAKKRSLRSESFEVVGLTDEIRTACREYQAGADSAMATEAYLRERRGISELMHEVWACVEDKGLIIGDDSSVEGDRRVSRAFRAAFTACRDSIEASRGLVRPDPLE